jgi:hypothetical protein
MGYFDRKTCGVSMVPDLRAAVASRLLPWVTQVHSLCDLCHYPSSATDCQVGLPVLNHLF